MRAIPKSFGGIGLLVVIVLVSAGFLFVAINSPLAPTAGDQLKMFTSSEEIASFLRERYETPSYGWGLGANVMQAASGIGAMRGEFDSAAAPSPTGPLADESKASSGDYSETNVQVEGVDEADIVKTDGKYIYVISGGRAYVIDAYPAEDAEILAEINVTGNPVEMYVNGDRLVLFTSGYGGYRPVPFLEIAKADSGDAEGLSEEIMPAPGYYGPVSQALVYDLSDRSNPALIRNMTMEGNYYDSRMVGDYVYAISQKSVNSMDSPGIPRILSNGVAVAGSSEVFYFDVPGYSYQFTSILSFNSMDESVDPKSKLFLMSYGQELYVSEENIYITYRKQVDQSKIYEDMFEKVIIPNLPPELAVEVSGLWNSDRDQNEKNAEISRLIMEHIEMLEPEESAVFMKSIEEKMMEYYAEMAKELERSTVHRISIYNGDINYEAQGSVPGYPLNQFSMDEHDSYFRIATTTSGWAGGMRGNTLNHMYVLDMNLDIVGRLENLAEGESIYSVRFMGDRGYMVTFKRVDPLFVMDLSDPFNPQVIGKLKIPGYSDYLHPYDQDHLIGIGMDTDTNTWGGVSSSGVKLSLFDVTDVESPKEISKYVIGGRGSYSYALHDHKAFLFDRDRELLVIPASVSDWGGGDEWKDVKYSDGAQVFRLNLDEGFVFRGEITHMEEEPGEEEPYYYPRYDHSVKRSLYMGDTLYTMSEGKMKMNSLTDLSDIKELVFSA